MFKDILVYLLQGDIFNMVGVKWGLGKNYIWYVN